MILVPTPWKALGHFVFLGGVTITYFALVELAKRRLMRKLLGQGTAAEPLLRSAA